MTQISFRKFLESFDTISDFLLNPDHRHKTWSQLIDEFEASGGQFLGAGKFGQVFEHPSWPYLLKIFNDKHYLKFVRYAYRNPHSAFPKFYGPPQHIVPYYRRPTTESTTYIVRMEKLHPVQDQEMVRRILANARSMYFYAKERGEEQAEYPDYVMPSREDRKNGLLPKQVMKKVHQNYFDLFAKYPQAEKFLEGIHLIEKNIKESEFDLHPGNVMQRQNGELVIVDPLWRGSNAYDDYKQWFDMETDRWGSEHEKQPEENLIGGKLPSRPWKKKPKKSTPIKPGEIPF